MDFCGRWGQQSLVSLSHVPPSAVQHEKSGEWLINPCFLRQCEIFKHYISRHKKATFFIVHPAAVWPYGLRLQKSGALKLFTLFVAAMLFIRYIADNLRVILYDPNFQVFEDANSPWDAREIKVCGLLDSLPVPCIYFWTHLRHLPVCIVKYQFHSRILTAALSSTTASNRTRVCSHCASIQN